MTDRQSMTTQELVRRTLLDEHGDFLKEAVAMVAAQLMEAEITGEIGAAHGVVSAQRVTHRNGYRPRVWETRVGEIELEIPKKRSGEAYFPSFLEPRRRCEQAIVAVVMEAYVNGVSTRKVDRLVEQLGIHGMTKDRVGACAGRWMIRSRRSAGGPWRARTPTCGSTRNSSRSETADTSTRRRW